MRSSVMRTSAAWVAALLLLAGNAVAATKEERGADQMPELNFQAPPKDVYKPRVGVPQFKVDIRRVYWKEDAGELAADQATTLLNESGRFQVIERAQIGQLKDEQKLGDDMVDPNERAEKRKVRGVDFILVGKVTNMTVRTERNNSGMAVPFYGKTNSEARLITECDVDLRLVRPSTGEILVAKTGMYHRTFTASGGSFHVPFFAKHQGGDITVREDDKGRLLRLALFDSLEKMMPDVDEYLKSEKNKATGNDAVKPDAEPAGTAGPAGMPGPDAGNKVGEALKKICGSCGTGMGGDANFCPKCGKPAPKPETPATAGEKKFCVKCGTAMGMDFQFCPKCGTKQGN